MRLIFFPGEEPPIFFFSRFPSTAPKTVYRSPHRSKWPLKHFKSCIGTCKWSGIIDFSCVFVCLSVHEPSCKLRYWESVLTCEHKKIQTFDYCVWFCELFDCNILFELLPCLSLVGLLPESDEPRHDKTGIITQNLSSSELLSKPLIQSGFCTRKKVRRNQVCLVVPILKCYIPFNRWFRKKNKSVCEYLSIGTI